MSALKVLFIGGSGVISSASAQRAVEQGIEVHIVNRGVSSLRPMPAEATVLHADVRDPVAMREVLMGQDFDAVVNQGVGKVVGAGV